MKLIVVNSSSSGNAYALDAGEQILLLEAGIKHTLVTKAIGFRDDKVIGCLVSHTHGDHARYAEEYASRGTHIYCNKDVREKKRFPFGSYTELEIANTINIGEFRVTPLPLAHDVQNFGYLIHHPSMGTLFFATDTYKFDFELRNVDHWLIEANYSDNLLKENVHSGKIDHAQANRLMLSHMSIDYTIKYLRECEADKSRNIILCHLSERNSDPDKFRVAVAGAFGVPTYIAEKGLVVELDK